MPAFWERSIDSTALRSVSSHTYRLVGVIEMFCEFRAQGYSVDRGSWYLIEYFCI